MHIKIDKKLISKIWEIHHQKGIKEESAIVFQTHQGNKKQTHTFLYKFSLSF